MAAMLPVIASAQDDMYFVPKKKAKQEKTNNTSTTVKENVYGQTQEPAEYYSGTLRDVDEYNRRGNTGRNVTIMTETDTFDIDESRLVLDEKGNYVLTPENIKTVYNVDAEVEDRNGTPRIHLIPEYD